MAQCFCGCDRKIRFGLRALSKRGTIIKGDVDTVEDLLARGMESPNAEAFVRDGRAYCATLAEAVHEGADPGPQAETETRAFMAFARNNFSDGALGGAVRRSGMKPDEAVAALVRGEFDPFADVQMS